MTEKEIYELLTKMYGRLDAELKDKRDSYAESYKRLLQDVTYDVSRQSSADRSICFEHNTSSILISMADCTGFIRGIEFAMEELMIAMHATYLELKEGAAE